MGFRGLSAGDVGARTLVAVLVFALVVGRRPV